MHSFKTWLRLVETAVDEAWELIQKGNLESPEPEGVPVKQFYQSLVKSIAKTPEEERWYYYANASSGGEEHWGTATNIPKENPLNQLAGKLTQYIEQLPTVALSNLKVSIPQLKDMGNKQELAALSPQNNTHVGFDRFMNVVGSSRAAEKRTTDNLSSLQNYTDPSVLLRLNGEYYVIGGRTRLMSSYATGRDAPVKVMDAGQVQQFLAQWQPAR